MASDESSAGNRYPTILSGRASAASSRLTEVRDVEPPNTVRHTYSYDAAGFVTSRDGVAFGYDATGAIASIGTVAAFDHDLDGRPVSRTLDGVTKSFRFGGKVAYSTAGTPIEADLGEVVIKLDGTGNRYRHMDFRGNVLFQTNAAGNVTGQAVYRGFGRFYTSGNLGERGFAGGFEIPSLGLTVLGPRVLDADVGRFLSQDPVFNAVNLYAYAQGNPVFFWDPTGAITASQAAVATGAAYAGGEVAATAAAAAGATGGVVTAAWLGGATFGLALYNFVAIAVDPDGSSRVTPQMLFQFLRGRLPPIILPNETGGGGGGGLGGFASPGAFGPSEVAPGTDQWYRQHPDAIPSPIDGYPNPFPSLNSINSFTFSIALSFGGAFW